MQPIRQLDTELANQIAAGEVVERPASVVKELLENSLDAGAKRIDIEITSGGTGLIRIRDDGSGIPKEQLTLALAPHATSKIGSLDDLDVIRSFGFRGEALASISSVSRFTLSSRTKDAEQGWQAEAEGSDRKVNLVPVAVALGTRIDVRELFFNTPARRRFLRTEKTEFSHIEEVVRKVVLANFNVAISLKHNSRMVRRFRAADNLEQQEQRVAAVCGRQFMQRSIRLDLEHEGIEIKGWLALPDYHRSQTDGQYFYVNNRPVKDRVLSHAIRQAYQSFIPEGRVPAYVLYLSIDPRKVDVNVHPTKHEVRFHNARLIHDLLVQSIERGLAEGKELIDSECLQVRKGNDFTSVNTNQAFKDSSDDLKQHQAYRSLLQSAQQAGNYQQSYTPGVTDSDIAIPAQNQGWRYLTRLNAQQGLLEKDEQLILLSIPRLIKQTIKEKLDNHQNEKKKLLFPEIIQCQSKEESTLISCTLEAFDIVSHVNGSQLSILEIPQWMEQIGIQAICIELANIESKGEVSTCLLENESANLILKLLTECDNLASLALNQLTKNELTSLFTDSLGIPKDD